jgi:hypothetical protein
MDVSVVGKGNAETVIEFIVKSGLVSTRAAL